VREAKDEQASFAQARAKVTPDAIYGNNPVSAVLAVAERMVAGEVLFREGKSEEGLAALREAVALEDGLRYDEPPEWINPVRHALGAALSESGRLVEAESVFREDLRRTPGNGWSLYGLSRVLELLKDETEAMRLHQQFQAVWKEADVQIKSACFCQQGV
jgi:Flp pilus assembly protein TadD